MEAQRHQIGKKNRRDSTPAYRTNWKARLVAFGIGILLAAVVFGIAVLVSEDLRLLYLGGGLLLAVRHFCWALERERI